MRLFLIALTFVIMPIIDLSGIFLREQTKPPYQTEGAAFAGSAGNLKLDNNWVLICDLLLQLQAAADVPAYNNAESYDGTNEDVVKYDDKLYLATYAGSPSAFSGIVPTNATYWTQISIGWIAHKKNRDQYLDSGGASQVSAADIYNKVTNCACEKYIKVEWTAADVQSGNSVPKILVPAVAGKIIVPTKILLDNEFDESSPGDSPYINAGNNVVSVKHNGADADIYNFGGILQDTQRVIKHGSILVVNGQTQYLANEPLMGYVEVSDPSGGTHGLTWYIWYYELTAN